MRCPARNCTKVVKYSKKRPAQGERRILVLHRYGEDNRILL